MNRLRGRLNISVNKTPVDFSFQDDEEESETDTDTQSASEKITLSALKLSPFEDFPFKLVFCGASSELGVF